jgi:restriction endonuclease S subunit
MRYDTYKESGIEWIGMIPEHWEVKKFSYCFLFSRGLSITKKDLKDEGIPCVNYGEIHSKYPFEIDPQRHKLRYVSNDFLKSSPCSLLKRGDFIFADTSEDIDGSGNFTCLNSDINTFAGYHTIITRLLKPFNYRFLAFFFDSKEFRNQIRCEVSGVKVFSITQSILKQTKFILPPLAEQTAIAAFLDRKTAEIDSLIEKKQQLLALYEEEKTAIINQAVTKGVPGRDAQIGRLHKSTNAGNTEDQPIIPGRDAQFGRLHKSTNADKTEDRPTVPGRDAQIGRLHKTTNANNTENQPTVPGRDAQIGRLHKSTNADNTEDQPTIPGRDAQIGRLYKFTNADNTEIATNTPAPIAYKYSGIEWIGMIPEHWEVKKLKYIVKNKLMYGANEPATEENQDDPRYIRISDFDNDGRLKADTFKSLAKDLADVFLLYEGDILFARSGATVGKTFHFKNHNGLACFAGYLIRATPKPNECHSDFIYFFTKSSTYDKWKRSIFNQSTIQNIGADKYSVLEIPIPPLAEQTAIVQYIETETQRIDRKIAKTKRLIKLLQEYKTTLISDVVTGQICVL